MFWLVMINEQWLCVASVVYDQRMKIWKTINIFVIKKAAKNKAHKRYENKKTKKTRMYIFYTQLSQRIFRLTFMYEMIVV